MAGIVVDVVNRFGAVGFPDALTGVVDDVAGGADCIGGTGGRQYATPAIIGEADGAVTGEVAGAVVGVGAGDATGNAR